MIAQIPVVTTPEQPYLDFLSALRQAGFSGEVSPDPTSPTVLTDRLVMSTDNSIYQQLPQAVVYPRHAEDLQCIARLMDQPEFSQLAVTPRGGGTGTNGQSLTDGVVVDISRHMNQILEIDVEKRQVRVQAGVVKDQLNAALKPHGLFFAPELSTSNRATIGGMINTDASGQGSCEYGKTRDHVLALSTVFLGGELWHSTPIKEETALEAICQRDDTVGRVHAKARDIIDQQKPLIEAKFPKLNRCLTGYDLAHLRDEQGYFNLNSILCGSEGSLGFIAEATLNVLPIPKHSALVNVRYAGFMDALRDAKALMAIEDNRPTSIETVDEKVLLLAMEDIVWNQVADYFPAEENAPPTRGINLIEFNAETEQALNSKVQAFTDHLQQDSTVSRIGHTIATGHAQITQVYAMRKRAVGLLGNAKGEKRPIPFVEDTAVPPENLADYIAEFRQLLDSHHLQYGMFGHVDAGVLHVRPAIDMKDPQQLAMVRTISDQVAALTQKYHGLLWGEHGKGVRSEYAPEFFGELYPSLQALKAAADPRNQINPGKIATPITIDGAELLKIDEVTTRGELDRQIDEAVWQHFPSAVYCNGNGACFNYDVNDPMCPSWKATRERRQSPKGRASLMREWLRQQGNAGVNVIEAAAKPPGFWRSLPARIKNTLAKRRGDVDFSHEVYDAMAGCLSCKSCAGQCPIKVSVPEFRSQFLELYHQRYLRPLKDYFIGSLEYLMPTLGRFTGLYNAAMRNQWVKKGLARYAGMVDSPLLSTVQLGTRLDELGLPEATPAKLRALSDSERRMTLVLVQDAFTSYFESQVVLDTLCLLRKLGFNVLIAPYRPNGKPLHVQGFMKAFDRAARRNAQLLRTLSDTGVQLAGLDPAMTLTYRQEYAKLLGESQTPNVMLLQEWLVERLDLLTPQAIHYSQPFKLLAHCTEKTNAVHAVKQWQQVFSALGVPLEVINNGCCGMAGTFGHEAQNRETSEIIYRQSWGEIIQQEGVEQLLATGYSCRSQVKRMEGDDQGLKHPVQALLHVMSQQVEASQAA
ncbi:FAD-linked oxidase [Terasakiispira papahanaumokuakeensis]|uniref:D-2-hydroxyglutarate dehydrogenase n=1 Tax=Terasakiispira papahanaumokuakeensis TaxID=197479 RepID=A0A1E2VE18_9GAMM|nr:FAD-binding and (Fe-S)-binding domain-containing protein [Terasakiispira papahanaumokuakeensis]ODC05066.1 FAD-linked oxidase [Terasakiispira papahanaumokuakeensis]